MADSLESKYAAALVLRKFTKISGPRVTNEGMAPEEPSFTSVGGLTYATDELGQTWAATTTHDLTSIGFKNNSGPARTVLDTLNLLPKTH